MHSTVRPRVWRLGQAEGFLSRSRRYPLVAPQAGSYLPTRLSFFAISDIGSPPAGLLHAGLLHSALGCRCRHQRDCWLRAISYGGSAYRWGECTLTDSGSIFPLEFFIAATPRALGASSNSKERWKAKVQEVARKRIDEIVEFSWLDQRPLALSIYYFSAAPMEGDVDNIIKPIMDALIGVAYPNDRVVERVLAQKFEPDVDWSFEQPDEILSAALDIDAPVVYVRVDDDFAWRRN